MIVVAVDPGAVTGVAVSNFGDDNGDLPRLLAVEIDEPIEVPRYVRSMAPDLLVVENFIPRPGVRTWQPDALHIIGALKFVAAEDGFRMELQSPADAKRFSTNDKLKRLGWYYATKGGHANDATRHLLLASVRHNLLPAGDVLQ